MAFFPPGRSPAVKCQVRRLKADIVSQLKRCLDAEIDIYS